MMRVMHLSELVQAMQAVLHGPDASFNRVSTDTRSLGSGDLFVALRGERFNAQDFVAEAAAKGAVAAIVETPVDAAGISQLQVQDSLVALGQLAGLQRQVFRKPLVGLTGSVGKTSCKEMLANILALSGNVLSTEGNLNNEIGVPLTLLRLSSDIDFAVIEMGAGKPGDIRYLCDIARPNIALLTTVAEAHLEGFGSIEAIAKTKAEIYANLVAGDTAVVNLDNDHTRNAPIPAGVERIGFSTISQDASVHATELALSSDPEHAACFRFKMALRDQALPIQLAVPGRHMVYNALAAAACALALEVKYDTIQRGLETYHGFSQRMQSHQGTAGSVVIDDSYNANPASMRAAIDVLAGHGGQRILIMGVMGELGEQAAALHADIGRYALQRGISQLLGVGDLCQHSVQAFGRDAHYFSHKELCSDYCKNLLENSSQPMAVLVKGSRSAGMETIVRDLLAETGEE